MDEYEKERNRLESRATTQQEMEFSDQIADLIRAAQKDLSWESIINVIWTHAMSVYQHADNQGLLNREFAARAMRELAAYVEQGIFEPPEVQ